MVHPHKIASQQVFEQYEQIQRAEFISTMLLVHLADRWLCPTGYVVFNGSKAVKHGDVTNATPLHHVAKGTVMQMGLNLSVLKLREDIVYENTNINIYLCDTLKQTRNKELMRPTDYRKDALDMEHVAHMFKYWASG